MPRRVFTAAEGRAVPRPLRLTGSGRGDQPGDRWRSRSGPPAGQPVRARTASEARDITAPSSEPFGSAVETGTVRLDGLLPKTKLQTVGRL